MQTVLFSDPMPYKAFSISFKAKTDNDHALAEHTVVFITKGEMKLFIKPYGTKKLSQGQVFILPRDTMAQISATTDTTLTFIEVPDMTVMATYFLLDNKSQFSADKNWFTAIQMDKLLTSFHDVLSGYMRDNKLPEGLIRIKVFELFYIISRITGTESLFAFFAPVVAEGYSFAKTVLENYTTVTGVEELATLTNYSISGFEKQFRKVFGIAPYKWILQQKAERVFQEILRGNKPLKVIADEFDFCNISHLGDFCRKYFGASPSSIRDRNKS